MQRQPELSIVMATYNRVDTLRRTLDYLAKQDLDPALFEVIIADDASPDNTQQVVEEMVTCLPYKFTYYRNNENRGPGFTQNRGIELACAPVVMIMTDDVFMEPHAVRAHLEYHQKHPEIEYAALGQVVESTELRDTALMRNWDPFRFSALEGAEKLPFYMFWACNISFKRELMVKHGMFREHRGRGGPVAFEDLEVGYRLSRHGMKLFYLPEAKAHHYHLYTIEQGIARWYERGLNFDEFRQYVPDPIMVVYFHVLNRHTLFEYKQALQGPNPFHGKEKSFAWHVIRELIRRLVLNRLTATLIWRRFLDAAEKSRFIERFATRQVYRMFFYYQFLRGVSDGYRRFGKVVLKQPEAGS